MVNIQFTTLRTCNLIHRAKKNLPGKGLNCTILPEFEIMRLLAAYRGGFASASRLCRLGRRDRSCHAPLGGRDQEQAAPDHRQAERLPRSEEHTSELQSLMRISY